MRRLLIGDASPRYLKLVYTASGALTGGKVTAWIGAERQHNEAYAPGFNVAN